VLERLVILLKCYDHFAYLVWVECALISLFLIAEIALLVDKVHVADLRTIIRAKTDNGVVISGLWGPDEVVLLVAKSIVL